MTIQIKQTNRNLEEQIKMFCVAESEAEPAVGGLFTAVKK